MVASWIDRVAVRNWLVGLGVGVSASDGGGLGSVSGKGHRNIAGLDNCKPPIVYADGPCNHIMSRRQLQASDRLSTQIDLAIILHIAA